MPDFNGRLVGAAGIAKAMAELPRTTERKLAIAALREGGRLIIQEAQIRAPKVTGRLRRSISQRVEKGAIPTVKVGIRKGAAPYAHFVEFGTVHSAPKPFMREALDTKARAAVKVSGLALGPAVEKEAARLAAKQIRR